MSHSSNDKARAERVRNATIDLLPRPIALFAVRTLLRMTPGLIHRASKRIPRLLELLATNTFVVSVETAKKHVGQFVLERGRLTFDRRGTREADLTQIWSSSREALRALTSSDETDLQRAFVAGHLKMRGSFLPILWLNEALKLARGRDSKQVTRFLSRDTV